jgi:hypothetical protein
MLTQLQIAAAKPKAKAYTLSAGRRLALSIPPTGAKLWRFCYRYGGIPKTLHIAPWPTISLAEAEEHAARPVRSITAGQDPVFENKRAKVTAMLAVATSFKEVALEWIEKCEREGRFGASAVNWRSSFVAFTV